MFRKKVTREGKNLEVEQKEVKKEIVITITDEGKNINTNIKGYGNYIMLKSGVMNMIEEMAELTGRNKIEISADITTDFMVEDFTK